MSKVTLLSQSCKGVEECGICVFVCPKRLFESSGELNEAGYVPPRLKDEKRCTQCRNCMLSCPDFALVVEGAHSEGADAEGEEDA